MNKIVKRLLSVVAITTISLSLISCGQTKKDSTSTAASNTIVVGLDDSFPPMGFKNSKGELQGFDIDMAKEIAKRTNKEIKFMPYNWDGIIPGLKQKKFDVIISAMSVTPEREKEIAFSTPYLNERQVIVVKKDNTSIASPDDLKGKTVGVQKGSTSEDAIKDTKSTFKDTKLYDENIAALQDLQIGRIDAVVVDELVARYYIKEKADTYKVLDKSVATEPIAIGLRQEDKDLKATFDKVIKEMQEDGTLAKISKTWFGEDITSSK
ncbi:amino acid ABC transporter substrate-binding protein [Clostridium fungisolvens]|uniref:L-cystine-binding protein FliY n=1 Tax=Clostridium fungisolvens TaxID=1604897 RepID=A0A6V8SLZ1_9CLOT|nr:amino acid ABC transporter substrate-binding protein [Clostridium fungisolvens]GFP77786.1 L-cystine-binding protein FliY [Clostridium fungisolvens]